MFNFFGKTHKEFEQDAKDIYKMNELPSPKKDTECFRIGVTEHGDTTLTLISSDGAYLTLTMSQDRCEQLIRMLQSTFIQNKTQTYLKEVKE